MFLYFRNLYFRTCYLLLMDVNPVFVLEGAAPELKYDTILARNAIQFKGARPKTDGVKTGKGRTRFHFVLKQCEEMLRYMGLACITGNGEAESLCAYLNEDGVKKIMKKIAKYNLKSNVQFQLVDGCISQDSDCFAYGAQVVYRNFSISTQGTQASSGGSVDVYDIRKANQNLSFGRNKIIAMALLLGCDYSEGVHGIGKESVLKLFETVSNDEVLDRLRSWRENINMFENYEKQLNDKNICTSCGHNGKIQYHTRNGCSSCKTTKGCDPFKYKNERLNIKNEVNMRNKAMINPNFPDEELIKEFKHKKDNVKNLDLKWKQPDIVRFIKFTSKFLDWEELYSFEKILPTLTRWQCRNPQLLKNKSKLKGILKPQRIKKVRNPKGVPSYEIIWSDPDECFKGLIPENQLSESNIDMEKIWSTIEPQPLVEEAYPDLVETYKQSKIKPKKVSKRKKKTVDELADKLENVSITEPKIKKSKKPKVVKKHTAAHMESLNSSLQLLTIEDSKKAKNPSYLKKALKNSCYQKTVRENTCSTPVKPSSSSSNLAFDPDLSSFGDESDLDVSDIIEDIISRRHNLNKVAEVMSLATSDPREQDHSSFFTNRDGGEDVSDIIDNIVSKKSNFVYDKISQDSSDKEGEDQDHLSFFTKNPGDAGDLFEKTFNETFKNFDSGSSDTEEYDLEDILCKKEADKKEKDGKAVRNYFNESLERLLNKY
ncbi:unnamed protein product [Ceutorhynchus assimilis]|uniref:XPG-I domain-containing protein n=1 Tax=Ceutorhynchus assimilis TaxID=467358 RepID=A0A9P0DDS8_9CUCU|nr:unnamed protein product [Ceutorhynchus assimilis]